MKGSGRSSEWTKPASNLDAVIRRLQRRMSMKAISSSRSGITTRSRRGLALLAFWTFVAGQSVAGDLVTEGKYYACLSAQWLEDFTLSAVRNDSASIKGYLADDKCLVLKPNLAVTVIDEPALSGTRIAFTIRGFQFYAPSEEIVRK